MHIVTEKAKHFCGDPELLTRRMTCRGVPGVQRGPVAGGQVTHSAVSGAAGAAPVTEGTLFECASLTKPLFAVLALQLADEGLLALDESVPARLGASPGPRTRILQRSPPATSSATAPVCRIGTAALCPCSLPRVRPIAIPARAIICCSTWRKKLRDNLSQSCLRAMFSRPFKCTAPPCFGRRGWAAPFLRALMRRAIPAACGIVWI